MLDCSNAGEKLFRKSHFFLMDCGHARFVKKLQGCVETDDTGEIHCSRFEFIRQKVGHFFRMGKAARTAGNERRHGFGHFIAENEAADALGTEKSLVARKAQDVNVHRLHVDGQGAGRLGAVDNEEQVVLFTKSADLSKRHDRTADVGRMGHDNCFCFRTDKPLHF